MFGGELPAVLRSWERTSALKRTGRMCWLMARAALVEVAEKGRQQPMANILTRTGDPERDPHPSVEDKDHESLCPYCEAAPDERHQPDCPLYVHLFGDLCWCCECEQEFSTRCGCDGHDDCEGTR